jgi:hypothetical protein
MLTDYFLSHGITLFASGWTQFAGGFLLAFFNRNHYTGEKRRDYI